MSREVLHHDEIPFDAREGVIETRARAIPCPCCGAPAGWSCRRPGEECRYACTGRVRAAYAGRTDGPRWLTVHLPLVKAAHA